MSSRLAGPVLVLLAALCAAPAAARPTGFEHSGFGSPGAAPGLGFGGFDRSRLELSTSITVGSGPGGAQGLQVTRLGYTFAAPLFMSVGIANQLGGLRGGSPYLESLSLRYQPSRSMLFHVEFRDVRSPLQLTPDADPFGRDAWWAR